VRHSYLVPLFLLSATACSVKVDYEGSSYACDPPDGQCPLGFHCSLDGRCVRDDDDDGPADASPGPLIDAGGGTPDAAPQSEPDWWDERWAHRRQLTIHNVSTDTLVSSYQVGVFIDLDGLLAPGEPTDSLRVMRDEGPFGWTEVTRVIDDVGPPARVWIGVWDDLPAGQQDDDYWIYYGNPSPPDAPLDDPNGIFDFFAGFGAFNPALAILGAATVLGGELRLDQNESMRTFDSWGPGFAVDFTMRMPLWSPRAWGGFQRNGDFLDDEPWMIWVTRSVDVGFIWPEVLIFDTGQLAPFVGQLQTPGPDARQYSVERTGAHIRFRLDQTVTDTHVLGGAFADDQQVRLANEGDKPVFFDWMRVRQIVEPEPQLTIGPEGDVPSP
jgi:hypothetical protein